MASNEYDYILAGGGLAGLSLADRLCRLSPQARVLIIEREAKQANDRTWCFWSAGAPPYQQAVHRVWDQIAFYGTQDFQRCYTLAPYRYHMIRGDDFYAAARRSLEQAGNVEFLRAQVETIEDAPTAAQVIADNRAYLGRWVFDSRYSQGDFLRDSARHQTLIQHFKGWEIETPDDRFDPSTATLFDFRTPQQGAMRFVYTLPLAPRRALVEYTLFSPALLQDEAYDRALAQYIEGVLGIGAYRITSTEKALIPMTDRPFARRLGRRILAIGTRGGRVKASTGYAFLRIQRDSDAIAHSLRERGHPFAIPPDSPRYRLLDAVMLNVMRRHGGQMAEIFTRLFRGNPIQEIFAFLNETAPLDQNLRLMTTLPIGTFLAALVRTLLHR